MDDAFFEQTGILHRMIPLHLILCLYNSIRMLVITQMQFMTIIHSVLKSCIEI